MHEGVDYALPEGTPVYPPAEGTVIKNFRNDLGGWSVLIRHPDGRTTGYADLRAQSPVAVGEQVGPSTVVGAAGSSGSNSTGSHLHYTVRNANGNSVDPTKQKWSAQNLPQPVEAGTKDSSGLPTYRAGRMDEEVLLKRAHDYATAHHFTMDQYDKLVKEVQGRVGMGDRLRERSPHRRWTSWAITSRRSISFRMRAAFAPARWRPIAIEQNATPRATAAATTPNGTFS
jgi:murein DD-endopeptidase MepM/ murein hydrolase activator NlpD